ncbi:MAG: GDP-mannose 4,6-dehydratase [bacterium]
MAKRILITGAGGFVGKHLVEALQKAGETDIYGNVYSASSDLSTLLPEGHILPADLTDFVATEKLVKDCAPDLIYHLASLSVVHNSGAQAGHVLTNNLSLQYNILESVRLHAPNAKIIVISSGNVYGDASAEFIPMTELCPLRPLNSYAVSKISQEFLSLQYHYAYGLDVVILRPFNHTGIGQTIDFLVPMLAKQFVEIKNGAEPIIQLGNTTSKRDFTDVDDIVLAYILAAKQGVSGEVYNLGSGIGTSISDIISTLQDLSGIAVQVKVDQSKVRDSDVPILVCNSTKFRKLTNWSPKIALRDTLKSVLDYYTIK